MPDNEEQQKKQPAKAKVTLQEWLTSKERSGQLTNRLRDLMMRKAHGRTDYDAIWEGIWRLKK